MHALDHFSFANKREESERGIERGSDEERKKEGKEQKREKIPGDTLIVFLSRVFVLINMRNLFK